MNTPDELTEEVQLLSKRCTDLDEDLAKMEVQEDELVTALRETNDLLSDLIHGPYFEDDLETRRTTRRLRTSNRALLERIEGDRS